MDFYQLQAFYTLCLHKNFTITATKLRVTQSAISHAIKKLETSINRKLIDKSKRKFSLTIEGEILYDHCKTIFYHLEKAQEDISELKTNIINLKIGAPVEFGSTVLVRQIKEFDKNFPFINTNIELHNEILPWLLKDEVDLIIDCKLHRNNDLISIPLFKEEYIVICTNNYIKQNNIQSPKDLEEVSIISLDEETKWWDRFSFSLPVKKRPTFKNIKQINHIRGIINGTLASMGVGLVPKYTVIQELSNNQLIQLFPELKLSEDQFSIYVKKEKRNLNKNKTMINFLIESASDFQAVFE